MTRIGMVLVGVVMLGAAVGLVPSAWPAALAGAIALGLAVPGRWLAAPAAAAAAAVVTTGIGIQAGPLPLTGIAAEGVLVLAFLLAADVADTRLPPGARRWTGTGVPVLAAGAAAAAACAVTATVNVPGSPWLALIGVAAASAALIIATGARRPG